MEALVDELIATLPSAPQLNCSTLLNTSACIGLFATIQLHPISSQIVFATEFV